MDPDDSETKIYEHCKECEIRHNSTRKKRVEKTEHERNKNVYGGNENKSWNNT